MGETIKKVMVVEDNELYAGLLATLMTTTWPYVEHIQIVGSLASALTALQNVQEWPDIILLDLRIPVDLPTGQYCSGLATLDTIIDAFPVATVHPPILVLTGDMAMEESALLAHGADEVQFKNGALGWPCLQSRIQRGWNRYRRDLRLMEQA